MSTSPRRVLAPQVEPRLKLPTVVAALDRHLKTGAAPLWVRVDDDAELLAALVEPWAREP